MSDDQRSLMESALAGNAEAVDAAVQRGAAVDEMEDGRTALHQAAAEGQLEVVKVLLFHKANPNRRSKMDEDNGGTALHLAAEGGHTAIMEELLQARANVEALDNKGRHATHRAASRGQRNALQLLKKHGSDFDARDGGKATPLHFASFYGDLETVQWLVHVAGVITSYKDRNGRQPKDVAKRFGNSSVHRFLKNSGGSNKKGMFGAPKARQSRRDSSRDRVHRSRDSSAHRRNESPAPSSEPETSLPVRPQSDLVNRGQDLEVHRTQPTSLPLSLSQDLPDMRASMPSLSPPDSPHHGVELRSHDSRRRTWSLRSSKGRSLKNQLEELEDIKARQEEELDFRHEEVSKLKVVLSQVEQEKTQAEEEVKELRYHMSQQQQQLEAVAEVQTQAQMLSMQNDEYQGKLNESIKRESELQEQVSLGKKNIESMMERNSLNQQTIEALTKEVERLSLDVKIYEEKLAQSQEALKAAETNAAAASTVATLREEVEHLTCMVDDTRENAVIIQNKLEQKLHELREQDEMNKSTIAMLSDRLKEAEMENQNSKAQGARLQQLQDQDTDNKLIIAELNAKVHQLNQNLSDHDHKTLTYHKQQKAQIEELTEKNDSNQTTIAGLSHEVDQLTKKLREQQDSIVWYQGQVQSKAQENEQKEVSSQQTISELKEEIERVTQKLEESQKVSLTQYERGGTVVALQKRDLAQKQAIKALENQLQHLSQKMADAEHASLSVQRQQLDTINKLKQQLEEASRGSSPSSTQGQQTNQQLQSLMEQDLSNKLIIEALNKKIDQLSEELKKNYSNFFSWQTQQQEKDKEHEQREAASQQTINELRDEVARLSRGAQHKFPVRQAPQPWRPSTAPPPVPYSQQYNHVSPPRQDERSQSHTYQQ